MFAKEENVGISEFAFNHTQINTNSLFNKQCYQYNYIECKDTQDDYYIKVDSESKCLDKNDVYYYYIDDDGNKQVVNVCPDGKQYYQIDQQPYQCLTQCPEESLYHLKDNYNQIKCIQYCAQTNLQISSSQYLECYYNKQQCKSLSQEDLDIFLNPQSKDQYAQFLSADKIELNIPCGITRLSNIEYSKNFNEIRKINIPDSVTIIGGWYDQYYENIEEVIMQDSVSQILNKTFKNWTNLKRITLSENVYQIMEDAFMYCTNLQYIKLPVNLKQIDKGVFFGCTNIKEFQIPKTVTYIGDYALGETGIEHLPDLSYVQKIGHSLFSSCLNLKDITIDNELLAKGDGTFYECLNLESVKFSNDITEIGTDLFCNCTNLRQVILPKNLKYIKQYAFQDCISLQYIILPESLIEISKFAFQRCYSLQFINIPQNIKTIFNSTFINNYNLKQITIPQQVQEIREDTFAHNIFLECVSIKNQNIQIKEDAFKYTKFENITDTQNFNQSCQDEQFHPCTESQSDILAFYGPDNYCINEENVYYYEINDENKKQFVFTCQYNKPFYVKNQQPYQCLSDCPLNMNYYTLQKDNVIRCLENCDQILNDQLECNQFYQCDNINTEDVLSFNNANNGNISKFVNNDQITIPCGVKIIDKQLYNYENKENIKQIIIPQSVISLQDNSFSYYQQVEQLQIPNSVQLIGARAFYNCLKLQTIDLPQQLNEIKFSLFENCEELEYISLPYGIQSIPSRTFNQCYNLHYINIPETVTSILEEVFDNHEIKSIKLPNNIYYLGSLSLYLESLEYINIPEQLKVLQESTFYSNQLQYIIIPESVQVIQRYTFDDCRQLKCIEIQGKNTKLEGKIFFSYTDEKYPDDFETKCTVNIYTKCQDDSYDFIEYSDDKTQKKCVLRALTNYYTINEDNENIYQDKCPQNQQYYINQYQPYLCVSQCTQEYQYISSEDQNKCVSKCQVNEYIYTQSTTKQCVLSCPQDFSPQFNNDLQRECTKQQSVVCDTDNSYYQNEYQENGKCQLGCNTLWYEVQDNNVNHKVCSNKQSCQDIINYQFISYEDDKHCIQNCNDNVWSKIDNSQKCRNLQNCNENEFKLQTNECIQSCKDRQLYQQENTCVESCSGQFAYDKMNQICDNTCNYYNDINEKQNICLQDDICPKEYIIIDLQRIKCIDKCPEDYKQETIDNKQQCTLQKKDDEKGKTTGIIVGATIGGIVVIGCCITAIILIRSKKNKKSKSRNENVQMRDQETK